MSKTSTRVPLGLLFKNESINEEMIDILQDLHNNYLPITKSIEDGDEVVTVIQKLFFGGDELTDERARHSKDARCDVDTEYERLEGFLSKVEDWHAVRILYQVLYDIFYKPGSGNDVGTMCSNLNVVNNVNARTTNVLDNLNYCKDYVNLETDAYITAAAMKYFNMDSLKTSAESFIPPNILDASKQRRRIWLHKHMEKMLYKFIMADQQLQYEDIRSTIAAANQLRRVSWFYCVVCGKPYKYLKAKENHVKKEHPDYEGETIFIPEESKEQVDSKSTSKEKDDVFDYARLRLSMGLFLRNFDDAIKEGDGERIIRCWKFALLIYRAYNHTKYALAALNLQAYTQAMLTPRLAHSLIWNRSVNNHGGPGRNIPLDLRLEHLNHLLKGLLKHLGPNLTESAAGRCSKAISSVERLLESVDDDLEVKRPKGHHKVRKSEADFQTLVNELAIKGDVFKNSPSNERCYTVMANFRSSLISGLDYTLLNKWITHHKKEFFKLEPII